MASPTVLIFSTAVILILTVTTAVREDELTVVYRVLRSNGYDLFANAISSSDLRNDLRSHGNFTLLAPSNTALSALDMTMPDLTTLRYHVIPRRMSMIDLLRLTTSSVPTLVPGKDIHVEQSRSLISIEGVDIVVPGMHYGRHVALHGLGGVLDHSGNSNRSSDPVKSSSAVNNFPRSQTIAYVTGFMVLLAFVLLVACVGLYFGLRAWLKVRKVVPNNIERELGVMNQNQ